MAPSDSSEIPAAMRALGDKGTWPDNVKRLYTLMLSRCSSTSNHSFPVLSWMARACPVKVAAGAAMMDKELALWENAVKKPDGAAAIQKANEMLYTTMALMTDDASEGGLAKNLAVDTGDIAIGDSFKLLQKFHDLFKQDASSMEDAEDLCEEVTSFKAIKNETAQVLVARFNALTTKLVGKSKTMKLPDIFLQTRFIRALTTTGVRNYTNVLDRHHRGEFKDLAALQKAVIDEEVVLLKKAHFQSTNGSVAAAARTTDANLAPGRTKAEKRKAKKARKRAKALAATGESTSTDSAACTTDGTTDAHMLTCLRALVRALVGRRLTRPAIPAVKLATLPLTAPTAALPLATRPKRFGARSTTSTGTTSRPVAPSTLPLQKARERGKAAKATRAKAARASTATAEAAMVDTLLPTTPSSIRTVLVAEARATKGSMVARTRVLLYINPTMPGRMPLPMRTTASTSSNKGAAPTTTTEGRDARALS